MSISTTSMMKRIAAGRAVVTVEGSSVEEIAEDVGESGFKAIAFSRLVKMPYSRPIQSRCAQKGVTCFLYSCEVAGHGNVT